MNINLGLGKREIEPKDKRMAFVTAYLPLPNGTTRRYRKPNAPGAHADIISRWQIDCFMQRLINEVVA